MNSKVVVIHLKKESMEVFSVLGGEKAVTAETSWTPETLAEKLRMVREKFETKVVRILLADELTYSKIKEVPEGEKIGQEALEKELEGEFPEAVGSMWEYKLEKVVGKQIELIFAPVKQMMDVISAGAIAANLKIEDMEPESFAKRRGDDGVLALARKDLKGKNNEVMNYKVEVVKSEGLDGAPASTASSSEVPASVTPLQRMDQPMKEKSKARVSASTKKLLLILLGVVVVGGVIVGGVLRSRSVMEKNAEPDIVISPVSSTLPTATPTPEPVNYAELSVSILNGSGVVGEAGFVSEVLTTEGFDEDKIEAGNAESYDYNSTVVQVKKGLSEEIYLTVLRALNSDYEVEQGEELAETSEYEVVVTVGTRIE